MKGIFGIIGLVTAIFFFWSVEALAYTVHVSDDTHINLIRPNRNYGDQSNVAVRNVGPGGERQGFVRFDLSTLPSGITGGDISLASMRLWVSSIQNPGSIDFHAVLEDWEEGILTAASAPALSTRFGTVAISNENLNKYVTIDLTAQVRDWIDGTVNNFGVAILPNSSEGIRLEIDSKENIETSHPIELEVALTATLSLPFNETISSDETAFYITNNGLSPAGLFRIDNSSNETSALGAFTNGRTALGSLNIGPGVAGVFANTDRFNDAGVLLGYGVGTGMVGAFLSQNIDSVEPTLMVGNAGHNSAGQFFTLNNMNEAPALEVTAKGLGNAITASSLGGGYALEAFTDGAGGAIYAATDGLGNAVNAYSSHHGDALSASSDGPGGALYALTTSSESAVTILAVNDDPQSVGKVISAINHGQGSAGWFGNHNPVSEYSAIVAYNRGRGRGVIAAAKAHDAIYGEVPSGGHIGPYIPAAMHGVVSHEAGHAGNFEVWNWDNDFPAVRAYHAGLGEAIRAERRTPGVALRVTGDVEVDGAVHKSSGGFKIDHPLDPENKYLYHSFVESPNMMNLYSGNVVLDVKGEAWVELPDYFEALNKDFRYQLTPFGEPGPNLHIAEKISNNRFKIAGGKQGMEVSWQVTGIRRDRYAEQHRIVAEVSKESKNRGKYLHPKEWGKAESLKIGFEETSPKLKSTKKISAEKKAQDMLDLEWKKLEELIAEREKRIQREIKKRKERPPVDISKLQEEMKKAKKLVNETLTSMQPKSERRLEKK